MSNNDRITIEPFEIDPSGSIAFGGNKLMTSSASCELADFVETPGRLSATATCRDQIGEVSGAATFQQDGPNGLEVSTPILSGSLLACFNDTASAQTDGGPIAQPESQPDQPAAPPATAPVIVEASYLNPQRNAVARVIADYCQPDFYETGHWGNGEWDQTYYERYKRQLLVKYLSDCKSFKGGEYLGFTVLDEMLSRNPHLFPVGPAQLPDTHAVVAGFYLRMKNDEEAQPCALPNVMGDNDARLWRTLDDLLARAAQGDQFYVASGYYAGNEASQRPSIVTMNVPSACRGRQQQRMLVFQMAIGAGLFLPL